MLKSISRILIFLTVSLIYTIESHGQDNKSGDTHNGVSLDTIVVYGETVGSQLRTKVDGTMLLNMGIMNDMPKILGNANPMHYAQMLPGVSTNGEYDAGFHVQGCETSHNYITIDGAPLYGVSHLLGIFSVFNASHFQQMQLCKSSSHSSFPNFIGAGVNMQTFYQPTDSMSGEMSVGLVSSQGTIRIPITKKSELGVSLRGSYINLLYKSLLSDDNTSLKYSFYDANVTYNHILNDKNRLKFNFYMGRDKANMSETVMMSTLSTKWDNMLASLSWAYNDGDLQMSDNAYYTSTRSDGGIEMSSLSCELPSSISEAGNKFAVTWRGWNSGLDISYYFAKPQEPVVESSYMAVHPDNVRRNAILLSPYIEREYGITDALRASAGVRGVYFSTKNNSYLHLSPTAAVEWRACRGLDFALGYSYRHQYLTRTGMTSINTPLEFWLPSGTYGIKPQAAHSVDLTTRYLTPDGRFTASVELYSRWLSNQTEYNGTFYSFLISRYELEKLLLNGKGHNYGVNLVVSKNKGWITGWIAYAYSRALRTYNTKALSGTFPSSHERPHEINGVVTLHIGKRWDIGLTGVWASGTPFTAPKEYYILNGSLVAEFAPHNSCRLKPYFRLDGSVNYHFNPGRHIREHGLNLSVYNMTASNHELFYYIEISETAYRHKCMKFVMRVLPSLSYYIKF